MASHVVVIDSSARRVTIKTTPSSRLNEVLQQACTKLGRDPQSYILKHNNKVLDLSTIIRLSGLANGAKLELVLSSRSPSAVSIALQLPEGQTQTPKRLMDKFASNTSLWMLLRHFESLPAANDFNITARGTSNPGGATTILLYETPVLQLMNSEYTHFADLQKTLAQLGYNSGNLLIRLSFRATETPFEEAKRQINHYFALETADVQTTSAASLVEAKHESPPRRGDAENLRDPAKEIASALPSDTVVETDEIPKSGDTAKQAKSAALDQVQEQHRPITILAAPSSGPPQAAQHPFNEKDYIPSVDHAKSHQSRLSLNGTNKRLLSDAELLAQAEEQRQRSEGVQEVEIKFRFPDQMQSISKFQRQDSAQSAYDFVQGLMANPDEPIVLRYSSSTGMKSLPKGDRGQLKLITDLKLEGRVLVNVVWDDGASAEARTSPVMKSAYRQQAQQIVVPVPETETLSEYTTSSQNQDSKPKESTGKRTGVPKWLKLPGKK